MGSLQGLCLFLWAFVALSVVLCLLRGDDVEYSRGLLRLLAAALLGSMAFAGLVTLSLWFHPWTEGRSGPASDDAPVAEDVERWRGVAQNLGLPLPRVVVVNSPEPFSLVSFTHQPTLVVSRGLLERLEPEEVDLVVAHELVHLTQCHRRLHMFSSILVRILPFDPLLQLLNAASHREREYHADWGAAVGTGRPGTLAMALLKLSRFGPPPAMAGAEGLVGRQGGWLSIHPPVSLRIERLLRLAAQGGKI